MINPGFCVGSFFATMAMVELLVSKSPTMVKQDPYNLGPKSLSYFCTVKHCNSIYIYPVEITIGIPTFVSAISP